ncbi:hypothetical protein SAMN02927900_04747 [Rhizobium mongolense subsp. loessense]|uniref:Uncharacterized protein n=1 Tax=Rhizobium mongolense subsp. loessense TaxID=158890 RepID=A0A1G4T6A4_9HYPH|nr:hypothetical protein [Rhizobium mongolense]SCW76992.1 hypothetical protein SAMN02927900_04747 [Rhizobium mongolense subsp. loessense]
MLEKMTHVKNPLSVVAIFACFAEVSGTAILPFLGKETQDIYVWFLMTFPTLLVVLFFAVLNWNHTVLYAPSDFKDETNWLTLLVKASPVAVEIKAQEEVAEAGLDEAGRSFLEDAEPVEETNQAELLPVQENDTPLPSPPKTSSQVSYSKFSEERTRFLRKRTKDAEQRVLAKLERERGLLFATNVSPSNRPNLVFDAVSMALNETTVVEVKYTARASYPLAVVGQVYDRVKELKKDMNVPRSFKMKLILVFITSDDTSDAEQLKLINRAKKLASNYPFQVEVLIYRYSETAVEPSL